MFFYSLRRNGRLLLSALPVLAAALLMSCDGNLFRGSRTSETIRGSTSGETVQTVTEAQAQSTLFQALSAWDRSHRFRRADEVPVDLATYAEQCESATGISIERFSCSAGVEIPGQGSTPAGALCDAPNVLNHQCDPGSRFQVLPGRTADAVAVAHCRKVGLPIAGSLYNDIAIIQYNKANGAVCFYQALSNLPGENIPSPKERGMAARWEDGQANWLSPERTHGIGCTGCHDNGGFVRSNYIAQLKTPPHAMPSVADGFDNLSSPLRYVGRAYAGDRSWSVETANAPNDTGPPCSGCHRIGVNNVEPSGTAMSFALIATAERQASKTFPHSPASPIWMRPGQVSYREAVEATAKRYRDCAAAFRDSGFTRAPDGCTVAALGEPFLIQGALGAACNSNSECASTYCDAGWNTAGTNRCMPRGGTGQANEPCTHNSQCATATCVALARDSAGNWVPGRCAAAVPLGGSCSDNRQCMSTYCDAGWNTAGTNRCMPRGGQGAIGEPCSHDTQCGSRFCANLTRAANGQWTPGQCAPAGNLGAPCTGNNQCASTYCDAGWNTAGTNRCMPRGGTGQANEPCTHNSQCASADCRNLARRPDGNWNPGTCR